MEEDGGNVEQRAPKARELQSRVSVRLSVRLSQAGIVSKRLNESSWVLARGLPSTCPTLCYEEIWVSPK